MEMRIDFLTVPLTQTLLDAHMLMMLQSDVCLEVSQILAKYLSSICTVHDGLRKAIIIKYSSNVVYNHAWIE